MRGRWRIAVVWALAQAGLSAAPATWDGVKALQDQVKVLRGQHKPAEALALCERFLIENPNADWMTGNIMQTALGLIAQDYPDPVARETLLRRVITGFERSPWYWAAAVMELSTCYIYGTNGFKQDYAAALEVVAPAWDKLRGKVPNDLYVYHYAGLNRVKALAGLKRLDEAEAFCLTMVRQCPQVLAPHDFLGVWWDVRKQRGDLEGLLGVARLSFVVCDYDEKALKSALNRCTAALQAKSGPGPGVLFGRCLDDPTLKNPLREVKLPDLGDPAALLQAAGEDKTTKLLVHLATGNLGEATRIAKGQLLDAQPGDQNRVARAVKNCARCFKAKDLSLKRANTFLDYHRTGEGDDPWPAFYKEVTQP